MLTAKALGRKMYCNALMMQKLTRYFYWPTLMLMIIDHREFAYYYGRRDDYIIDAAACWPRNKLPCESPRRHARASIMKLIAQIVAIYRRLQILIGIFDEPRLGFTKANISYRFSRLYFEARQANELLPAQC